MKKGYVGAAKKARIALAVMALCSIMGSSYAAGVFEGTAWEETTSQAVHDAALNHDNNNDFKYTQQNYTETGLAFIKPTFMHSGHDADCGNADKYYASLKAVHRVAEDLYDNDKVLAAKIGHFTHLNQAIKANQHYTNSLQDKDDATSGTVVGALNAVYDIASSKANPNMDNLTDAGKLNVKKLVQDAVMVKGEGAVVVTSDTAADSSKTTYTVNVSKDGKVAKGDTNLVTGDTVYNAIQNIQAGEPASVDFSDTNYAKGATTLADGVKAVDAAVKATDDKVGDNQYTSENYVTKGDSSTAAISKLDAQLKATDDKVGDNKYTSTNYVTAGQSSTAAISALDSALKTANDGITQLSNGKADTDLSNLSDAGKLAAKKLAQDAIAVEGTGYVTVDSKVTEGKTTYTVSVAADGQVADGNTGLVTGGTVYAVTNGLDEKITAEAAAREAGDAKLQSAINTVDSKVGDNQYTSTNYVSAGQNSTAAISALDTGLGNEAAAREAADIALGNRISKLGSRIGKVGAGAAALAALHPLDFDRENKLSFAVGYGNYAGENAAAIGGFYRPNENVMFSVAGTMGNGENMVNAGISFALGSGSTSSTSKSAMADKIKAQEEKIQAQDAQIQAQSSQIQSLNDEIAELKAMFQQFTANK